MRIGLLIIATNRYVDFVPPLVESARAHFLRGRQVDFIVLTNRDAPPGTIKIDHGHEPWPMPTLKRYHAFARERAILQQYDYLFYSDADMRFVADVGDEILGDLVAVHHPGFWRQPRSTYTFEDRPESTAFIPPDRGTFYAAGGFQGGRAGVYLDAAHAISRNIDADLQHNLIARWHDESHWNRYLLDHPPTVLLDPSYCFPQGRQLGDLQPKLLALNKDHDKVRGVPLWKRLAKQYWAGLRRRLVRSRP